ncbi:xyloglucan endotransglucosylase protein 6-like [Carex rostrata]
MAVWKPAMAIAIVLWISMANSLAMAASKFDDVIQPSWANDHIIYDGDLLMLKLDNSSGTGFASKSKYLYGKATAEMKLVPGDSAGTVTAFYLSTDGDNHHELDFEFLGNRTGEPYLVQTNLYINGTGNREQRMDLWFDPTTDFHNYSVLWNPQQVVFLIDDAPIRVYSNQESTKGIPFPRDRPMMVYSSLWNADDWATEGGRVKTDWSHAPFVTTFREVRIDGCEWGGDNVDWESEVKRCSESQWGKEGRYWWKEKEMEMLNVHQSDQLLWARSTHLVYDYCNDPARFPVQPAECAH